MTPKKSEFTWRHGLAAQDRQILKASSQLVSSDGLHPRAPTPGNFIKSYQILIISASGGLSKAHMLGVARHMMVQLFFNASPCLSEGGIGDVQTLHTCSSFPWCFTQLGCHPTRGLGHT